MTLILRIYFILFFLSITSTAHAEFEMFFPSSKIHEDDRIDGNFEMNFEQCKFIVTKTNVGANKPNRIMRLVFDLNYFETDPNFVGLGFHTPKYTSRSNVVWLAKGDLITKELDQLREALSKLRITLGDRIGRNKISLERLRLKSQNLTAFSDRIKGGEFGEFAQNNYIEYYSLNPDPILVSFIVSNGFHLPAKDKDARRLVEEMHKYKLSNCY